MKILNQIATGSWLPDPGSLKERKTPVILNTEGNHDHETGLSMCGESPAMSEQARDFVQDLNRRLLCLGRFDQNIENSAALPDLQFFWKCAKSQELKNIDQMKKLVQSLTHSETTLFNPGMIHQMTSSMTQLDPKVVQQLALAASRLQERRTGHLPTAVSVVLLEDTLVVSLHDALTPAEKALAKNPEGAAHVQEYHRQLFVNSHDEMLDEIKKLTGREVCEAASEVEPETGTVVHAFTTGTMVQVFLLAPAIIPQTTLDPTTQDRLELAENNGLPVIRNPDS